MRRTGPWLLAGGAGTALAVALPGAGLWILVFAFPGLLLESLRQSSRGGALLRGWLAGTLHWVIAANWVMPVMRDYGGLHTLVACVCLVLMAAILGTTWAIAAWITLICEEPYRPWVFPAVWIITETTRQWPPWIFPWNPTAAVISHIPRLLGSLPVWGSAGLGWALTAFGIGMWCLLRPATRRTGAAITLAALLLTGLTTLLAPPPDDDGRPLKVAALQPGTSLEEKWDPSLWQEVATRVWQGTEEAAAAGAELVLWPESAMPYRVEDDLAFASALEGAAAQLDLEIVFNGVGTTAEGGATNSAYLVSTTGLSATRYDKIRLVPFGEYVPPFARLAFTESLVREVASFTPGFEPVILPAQIPLGVAICYEVVYPGLMVDQVRRGAQLLITLTNDGWYGYSWAPTQHFAQVVLRAVETRRWFVRAALTGISGIVDPRGRVRHRLAVGETGVLVAQVKGATVRTPRVRWGNWWTLTCGLATLVIVLLGHLRHRR